MLRPANVKAKRKSFQEKLREERILRAERKQKEQVERTYRRELKSANKQKRHAQSLARSLQDAQTFRRARLRRRPDGVIARKQFTSDIYISDTEGVIRTFVVFPTEGVVAVRQSDPTRQYSFAQLVRMILHRGLHRALEEIIMLERWYYHEDRRELDRHHSTWQMSCQRDGLQRVAILRGRMK